MLAPYIRIKLKKADTRKAANNFSVRLSRRWRMRIQSFLREMAMNKWQMPWESIVRWVQIRTYWNFIKFEVFWFWFEYLNCYLTQLNLIFSSEIVLLSTFLGAVDIVNLCRARSRRIFGQT